MTKKFLINLGFEPRTFSVLTKCDNHYTSVVSAETPKNRPVVITCLTQEWKQVVLKIAEIINIYKGQISESTCNGWSDARFGVVQLKVYITFP